MVILKEAKMLGSHCHLTGHAIVPATIAPGTTLYHGRRDTIVPTEPDWLAFDPDHSYIFCAGTCVLQTYVTMKELRLAYFDGVLSYISLISVTGSNREEL